MQDRILNGRLAADLVDNRLLTLVLILTALVENLVAVNVTALLRNRLPTEDVHANNVMLVEALGPTLWNAILDFILYHLLVGALCERLRQ